MLRQSKLKRSQVPGYFCALEASNVRCVAMEACGGAPYYWGCKFEEFGLPVRLLPPKLMKAYVMNNKTDANDSVAIAEAACGGGQIGDTAGSNDVARSAPAVADDAHAVVQLDSVSSVGKGVGDRSLESAAGRGASVADGGGDWSAGGQCAGHIGWQCR